MGPRRQRHPWPWAAGGLAGLLALLLSPMLFPTTVICRAQSDPVMAFLVDHGATPTLVVPRRDGALVRYAYGDWQYYALANNHVLRGLAAVTWPTQGTLGRAVLDGPADAENVRRQVRSHIEEVHALRVEREAADRLVAGLEAVYEQHRGREVINAPYGMRFVHHPQRYTYFNNSNHTMAGWLQQLGCQVRGPAFYSRWRLD